MKLDVSSQTLTYPNPLVIAGYTFHGQEVLRLQLGHGGHTAMAEAAGVFYLGDTIDRLLSEAKAIVAPLEACGSLHRAWQVLEQVRPGGLKNALDWCLWQLEAHERRVPIWRLAHLPRLRPLPTTVTLSVDSPERMAAAAKRLTFARALKLKLDGGQEDPARVAAVRDARPDVRLMVDANQGWDMDRLTGWMAALVRSSVELIEQPLPAGRDDELVPYQSPIPIAADESLQTIDDLDSVVQRYNVANIKLDKCGGLSAALTLAHEARNRGLRVMVGCMGGSSLAMQPAFVAGQLADIVDLDAPLILAQDTAPFAQYEGGRVSFDEEVFRPQWAHA